MYQDICQFIPYHEDYHSIHTIHFVLETLPQSYTALHAQAVYKMHLVRSGSGFLHTPVNVRPLKPGDIFFTFPAKPFCIESGQDFTYMYVSFLGSRANMILDKLSITSNNCFFSDCDSLLHIWEDALHIHTELSDIASESILLYTFAFLGNCILDFSDKNGEHQDAFPKIKKYIDDHFTNNGLSLEYISQELAYNPKYISSIFKKNMSIGIVEYLNTIRIQHACTLIRQGFTSINDISVGCGFSDAQYFSKVFKQKMGMPPSRYVHEVKESPQ